MATFAIDLTENDESTKFFVDTQQRLETNNFVKNPFRGGVRKITGSMYLVYLEPVYFNFTPFIWVIVGALLFYKGWTWWLIIPMVLGSLGIFWSKYFFYYMLKLGLKKAGYKDKVKLVSLSDFIKKVYFEPK